MPRIYGNCDPLETLVRLSETLEVEFAIDVAACKRRPQLLTKRARTVASRQSYVQNGVSVTVAVAD